LCSNEGWVSFNLGGIKLEEIIKSFRKNNFTAYFVHDKEEAKNLALSLIPQGATVGMGNSLTLRETGIFEELTGGKYNVINQFEAGLSREENLKLRKQSMISDVYFTSVNAISKKGELFNIDGKGNRVAAMMFGPDKVIIVVGINKIVEDEEGAWIRLKDSVSPKLAKKLNRKTPCAITGVCSNCDSPERICRHYTVIRSQMLDDINRINIIIIDEELGI
jgi:L-lactate utilization protein LutB